MHKNLSIITTLLLCTNIAVGSQDSGHRAIPLRVKPTDASGIILASRIMSNSPDNEGVIQSDQTLSNTLETTFLITKVGIDPIAIALPLTTVAAICGGTLLVLNQKDNLSKAIVFTATAGWVAWLTNAACGRFAKNMDVTCDQYWFKTARASDGIKLRKIDGTWQVHQKNSENKAKLSDQEVQQLAEAIIASHNPDVKDEDLYTSEIFQKLISDFKAPC